MKHAARTTSAYLATGGVAILSLAALNIAADRINSPGLQAFRNYVVRGNN